MASAAFTINGTAVPCEVAVSAGAPISLALTSTDGAHEIAWSISASSETDPAFVAPTITASGAPLGATASFTMGSAPAHGRGIALIVTCTIRESNGTQHREHGVVGIVGTSGIVPLALQEQIARSRFGWLDWINSIAAGIGSVDLSGYVPRATPVSITAQHTFDTDSGTPPFVIGTGAQDELVTGLNADELDGQHGSYYTTLENSDKTASYLEAGVYYCENTSAQQVPVCKINTGNEIHVNDASGHQASLWRFDPLAGKVVFADAAAKPTLHMLGATETAATATNYALTGDGSANALNGTNSVSMTIAGVTKRIEADGTGVGFFSATPVAKPTVTGSRNNNDALASLLTALADLGLITNDTQASDV